jgi:hypothetical protein
MPVRVLTLDASSFDLVPSSAFRAMNDRAVAEPQNKIGPPLAELAGIHRTPTPRLPEAG